MFNFEVGADTIITAFVTFIGIIVAYKASMKTCEKTLLKEKNLAAITKMDDTTEIIVENINALFYSIAKQNTPEEHQYIKKFKEDITKIEKTIIHYGNADSMKIITYIRHNLLNLADKSELQITTCDFLNDNRKLISALSLLLFQVKYDLYGIKTSPQFFYYDFFSQGMLHTNNFYADLVKCNNSLVKLLHLKKFLKVKKELKLHISI